LLGSDDIVEVNWEAEWLDPSAPPYNAFSYSGPDTGQWYKGQFKNANMFAYWVEI
jgi:hypothetical protein